MLGLIMAITVFQGAGIVLLIYQALEITTAKLLPTLTSPFFALLNLAAVGTYFLIVLLYARPLTRLLSDHEQDREVPADQIIAVQDRALKLPPFMAGLAFPSYVLGTAAIIIILSRLLDWEQDAVILGLFAGCLAGLLSAPMLIYSGNWLVFKVIGITTALPFCPAPARLAGVKVSVPMKMVVPVVSLVGACSGYMALTAFGKIGSAIDWVYLLSLWTSCVLLSLLIALAAGSEFARPIRALRRGAERVMQGRFDHPVHLVINDDLADLGEAFNRMMSTINGQFQASEGMVERLQAGIAHLDDTADTLMEVAAEQSSGATEQASAVAETSSIAEEIVATARQIAERAQAVLEVAGSTLAACDDGETKLLDAQANFLEIEEHVKGFARAMVELEGRFQEIYKFVEWMEDIADQTELLALNASLEAAGAGAEGLRFNVVAEATRRLAVRSAGAAKEIRGLVESVQQTTVASTRMAEAGKDKVDHGAQAIYATAQALRTISDFATSTSSSVREITLSTQQQTTASEQLAASVSEVSEVASRVEDGAKQIESAISQLRAFSDSLREIEK
jgi:methyl-accepting chemotaxis protein